MFNSHFEVKYEAKALVRLFGSWQILEKLAYQAFKECRFEDAKKDALRLSRGMTYKAALANTGTGGGKSVIIADPKTDKSPALLQAFAEAVHTLGGTYYCAEDVGCSEDDVDHMYKFTPYVVGHSGKAGEGTGDPSRFTAWGVFVSLKATAKKLWGSDCLKGKTFALQGLGAVGFKILEHLFWSGAKIVVTDVNQALIAKAKHDYGVTAVSPDEIYSVPCDIFVPCAMGGILNSKTIPQLNCKAVCGGSNNQLLTEQDGFELAKRDILYAPDYLVNSGGIINCAFDVYKDQFNLANILEKTTAVYDQLLKVFEHS